MKESEKEVPDCDESRWKKFMSQLGDEVAQSCQTQADSDEALGEIMARLPKYEELKRDIGVDIMANRAR